MMAMPAIQIPITSPDTRSPFQVQVVASPDLWQQVLDLRFRILRQPLGLPPSSALFSGDDAPSTLHVVVVPAHSGTEDPIASKPLVKALGCGTLLASPGKIQLRGMAVEPDWQGQGIGQSIVRFAQRAAHCNQCSLWCNARIDVVPFYELCGMTVEGDAFDIPDIGVHRRMRWNPPLPCEDTRPRDSKATPAVESIQLDQFLKLSGCVGSGGQAKYLIQQGNVQVNGQTETRRKRKLVPGDRVNIDGEEWIVQQD
jgi:ribosome-associated protein